MSQLFLCHLHDEHEEPHWTGSPVGVRTLHDGQPTDTILPADRECARRNIADRDRIVDIAQATR